ncbi:MAG: hypothetical protein JXR34_08050 [Bacteroidales bacterium]|nr:hypothetical protein [Bacteroidales bacterium]
MLDFQLYNSLSNPKTRFRFFGTMLSFTVFLYLALKAFYMPLYGDEAATFYFYAIPFEINPLTAHADANNHPLNSFLTAVFYHLFESEKVFLRLGSLIAFPIFAVFSILIAENQNSTNRKWLTLIALLFSHNLIEFFSVSRGYGLSMAFLLATYYYLIQIQKTGKFSSGLFFILAATLMLSSNLSLMIIYLISGILALFAWIVKYRKPFVSVIVAFVWAIPLVFFLKVSFYYKDLGLLYYGTLDGFWEVTVKSVIALIFNSFHLWIGLFFVILFLLFLSAYLISFSKLKFVEFLSNPRLTIFHFLIGNVVAVILMGLILKVNYPEDRVGMHLYLLFIVAFFEVFDVLNKPHNRVLNFLPFVVIALPIHFIYNANIKVTACYKDDYLPEKFYSTIAENSKNQVPIVGTYRTKAMGWHFQNYRQRGHIPYVFWTHFPDTISDFVIAKPDKNPFYSIGYESIISEKINGRHVLKRKTPIKRRLIYDSGDSLFTGETAAEFIPIWDIFGDSLNAENLFFEYDLKLSSDELIRESWVVLSANDSLFQTTQYEFTPIYRAQPNFDRSHFHFGMVLFNTPQQTSRKVSYIWNVTKKNVTIYRNRLKIYILE